MNFTSIRQFENGDQNEEEINVLRELQMSPSSQATQMFDSMHAGGEVSIASDRPNPSTEHWNVNSSEIDGGTGREDRSLSVSRDHESLAEFSQHYHKHQFVLCFLVNH
jgi:hypothetical protein